MKCREEQFRRVGAVSNDELTPLLKKEGRIRGLHQGLLLRKIIENKVSTSLAVEKTRTDTQDNENDKAIAMGESGMKLNLKIRMKYLMF